MLLLVSNGKTLQVRNNARESVKLLSRMKKISHLIKFFLAHYFALAVDNLAATAGNVQELAKESNSVKKGILPAILASCISFLPTYQSGVEEPGTACA